MAYRKRYTKTKTIWRNRARYAYGKGRKAYNKMGLNINMPFMAGFAGAFILPENEMLTVGSLVGATAPIKGLGMVKGAAQGYVLGQVTQKWILPKLGINFGNIMGPGQNNYPGSNIV